MKILICGGEGQLGTDCAGVLGENHKIMSVDLEDLDITVLSNVQAFVQDFGPDVILNCAAYTLVDTCETKKDLAWKVNVLGPENLARSTAIDGSRLIHISTDYVFDGRKVVPEPYSEKDKPNPLSCYGATKLQGEEAIRKATNNHIILRTAWLYGLGGPNFLKTMLKLALEDSQREIKVVNDQFGSPTWSYRLALQIKKLIEKGGQGTYNATSEGYCTWYALAISFLEKMGVPHSLVPCATVDYPTPAHRPRNSILENKRLKEEGVHIMRPWQDDLDQFCSRLKGIER